MKKVLCIGLMAVSLLMTGNAFGQSFVETIADLNSIVEREWVLFETATTPRQKETKRILQLLNPGQTLFFISLRPSGCSEFIAVRAGVLCHR